MDPLAQLLDLILREVRLPMFACFSIGIVKRALASATPLS